MKDEKGIYTFRSTEYGHFKEYYDPSNLEDVNRVRLICGDKQPLSSLNGYCMSTGCSCDPLTKPICGLFKSYESDGVKKDFLNQLFGI